MRGRRLRWALAIAGLAVLLLAAGAVVSRAHAPLLAEETCQRIQTGMTRGEVDAILGAPPGDYRTGPTWTDLVSDQMGELESKCKANSMTVERWQNDDRFLLVVFDSEGRVFSEMDHSDDRQNIGRFDVLRWWAKRQWHRWFP